MQILSSIKEMEFGYNEASLVLIGFACVKIDEAVHIPRARYERNYNKKVKY